MPCGLCVLLLKEAESFIFCFEYIPLRMKSVTWLFPTKNFDEIHFTGWLRNLPSFICYFILASFMRNVPYPVIIQNEKNLTAIV